MGVVSRRRAAVASAALALGLIQPALGQSSLVALGVLLVDIPGWESEPPTTVAMTDAGTRVSYAARSYERSDTRMLAMLGRSGLEMQAQSATGGNQGDVSLDAQGTSIRLRSVRGFRVFTAYDPSDRSGMVLVFLGARGTESSTFVLQFDHLSLDEAMAHAQRFDWTAMQRAIGLR